MTVPERTAGRIERQTELGQRAVEIGFELARRFAKERGRRAAGLAIPSNADDGAIPFLDGQRSDRRCERKARHAAL